MVYFAKCGKILVSARLSCVQVMLNLHTDDLDRIPKHVDMQVKSWIRFQFPQNRVDQQVKSTLYFVVSYLRLEAL